jgi:nitrite reductase/ring-hydroxylating ferredoxin subunit
MARLIKVGEVDDGMIICPWHSFDFNVKTGECSVDPDLRVVTYIVKTQGDDLFIEVA